MIGARLRNLKQRLLGGETMEGKNDTRRSIKRRIVVVVRMRIFPFFTHTQTPKKVHKKLLLWPKFLKATHLNLWLSLLSAVARWTKWFSRRSPSSFGGLLLLTLWNRRRERVPPEVLTAKMFCNLDFLRKWEAPLQRRMEEKCCKEASGWFPKSGCCYEIWYSFETLGCYSNSIKSSAGM